jgi:ferredoxin-nitrate reductase
MKHVLEQASCRIEILRQKYMIEHDGSLREIAKQHKLSIEEIAKINRLMPPYRADIGSEVEVPLSTINVEISPYAQYPNIENFPHFKQAELPLAMKDKKNIRDFSRRLELKIGLSVC